LIGDDVEVIVTELSKGVVKLGILAPVTRTILRGETKDVADAKPRRVRDLARSAADPQNDEGLTHALGLSKYLKHTQSAGQAPAFSSPSWQLICEQ